MKTLTILLVVFVLSGCAFNYDEIKDSDFSAGCYVVGGQYNGTFANGSAQACKLKCSDNLPSNFKYTYQSNGCNISIGE